MNDRIIIGLGYRARSGKDTVGAYLVKHHGFARISFADKLKEVVGKLYNCNAFDPGFKDELLSNGLTGGQTLQRVGVHMRQLDPNIWIAASGLEGYAAIPGCRIVVTDCRFENEAAAVKRLGGYLWEIRRPGLPTDSHSSEVDGKRVAWDTVIHNNSTVKDLETQVYFTLRRLCEPAP